ncbi:calcium binding EGF domain protein [Ancylostoma duodenale]|uniref:Calcium binding EGF domain protein n=1 Tax=Ancylostoma duodenale TaxID=51022 RepID=A0A0C2GJD9_9BILA|nr:calcium binding EGF domain protein [Ancylostoma duodenale]
MGPSNLMGIPLMIAPSNRVHGTMLDSHSGPDQLLDSHGYALCISYIVQSLGGETAKDYYYYTENIYDCCQDQSRENSVGEEGGRYEEDIMPLQASPNIRGCPHCDPLFGVCEEGGECGCIAGFRKLGKICIDVNECDQPNACPPNSRCVNTMGSFRCDCDAGFSADGQCMVKKDKEHVN